MTQPLDPAQDPDRYRPDEPAGPLDPALDPDRYRPEEAAVPLDPAQDPDRYDPERDAPSRAGRGRTLTDLLGEGAQEDARDNLTWLLGLVAVLAFLLLVSALAHL